MAKFIITLPTILFFGIFGITIPGYLLHTFDLSTYFKFLQLWMLYIYLFECVAEFLAIWTSNKTSGMMLFLIYWVLSFLFGGVFLPADEMFWPIKLLYYIFPMKYFTSNIMYILYKDATFEWCDPATSMPGEICIASTAGTDVLKALANMIPVTGNPNLFNTSIILLGMILFFKLFYIVGVMYKFSRTYIPIPIDIGQSNPDSKTMLGSSYHIEGLQAW